jgi:hypothetical protein
MDEAILGIVLLFIFGILVFAIIDIIKQLKKF